MKGDYVPGRRNIGPHEVRRRRRSGFLGAAATIVVFMALLGGDAPRLARVVLAIPIFVATIGFVQATTDT